MEVSSLIRQSISAIRRSHQRLFPIAFLVMDEHPRDSDASIADFQPEDEQEAPAARVLELLKAVLPKLTLNQNHIDAPLKMLLEKYSARCAEVGALSKTHLDTLLKVVLDIRLAMKQIE